MENKSYEVQVMQGGKWRIHAQFPGGARDDAIDEAKTLETMPGIIGIKVVQDTYDDRTGLHREHVVYKHQPKASPATARVTGSSAAPSTAPNKYAHYMARAQANRLSDFDDGMDKAQAKKKTSGVGVVVKLLLVLLFSIAAAAVLTLILNAGLPYKKIAGIALYGQMRANVLMGASVVSFVLSVIVTFKIFMGRDELDAPDLSILELKQREDEKRKRDQAKKQAEDAKKAREQEKQRTKEEDEARKKQAEEELKRKAEEDAKQNAGEDSQEEAAKDEEQEEKEEEFSRLSPAAELQKTFLMNFFGESIRSLPAERKKMDNYNRFGVNLYLAGAVEALGGERNLDGETVTIILADALQVMGLKPEHADAFARRYEDYLLQDARYMEMFQAGRRNLSNFLGGDKDATANLDKALHEWNKPSKPEDPEREVVVMFTDIAGSTAMTHEKGNLAAQEVVRAHNKIVREALAKTGGKEIKHTGDGIMASFENVTKSLLATQQMQMMIQIHNEQNPDVPLKVKIGINAGRVVVEENDLYGVTVQMAARVVDKAKADMILVSETVYGMAKGGNSRFVKRGPFYLKGIDGPAYLQEFVWDDNVDIEAVKAQAESERPQLEQVYVAASGQPLPGQPVPGQPVAPNQPATPAQVQPAAQPVAQQPAAQPAQTQPVAQAAPQPPAKAKPPATGGNQA